MFEPKRLHPIAVLLNIIKSIKELVIPFLLVVVIMGRMKELWMDTTAGHSHYYTFYYR